MPADTVQLLTTEDASGYYIFSYDTDGYLTAVNSVAPTGNSPKYYVFSDVTNSGYYEFTFTLANGHYKLASIADQAPS